MRNIALVMALCLMFVTSCGKAEEVPRADGQTEGAAEEDVGGASDAQQGDTTEAESGEAAQSQPDITDTIPLNVIDDNYRTYYEVFVYSFYDSNGDGIGDLQGLISKLDYINDGDDTTDTDLGCNGIWLMPVHPSPTYHKYDVTDYYDIDPVYGTLDDFHSGNECVVDARHEKGDAPRLGQSGRARRYGRSFRARICSLRFLRS